MLDKVKSRGKDEKIRVEQAVSPMSESSQKNTLSNFIDSTKQEASIPTSIPTEKNEQKIIIAVEEK